MRIHAKKALLEMAIHLGIAIAIVLIGYHWVGRLDFPILAGVVIAGGGVNNALLTYRHIQRQNEENENKE